MQVEYPPPYQRHVQNYAKANKDIILSSLENDDKYCLFVNKTVHEQENLLNDIILNVFANFLRKKFIAFDDRDPTWIIHDIKNKIKSKQE